MVAAVTVVHLWGRCWADDPHKAKSRGHVGPLFSEVFPASATASAFSALMRYVRAQAGIPTCRFVVFDVFVVTPGRAEEAAGRSAEDGSTDFFPASYLLSNINPAPSERRALPPYRLRRSRRRIEPGRSRSAGAERLKPERRRAREDSGPVAVMQLRKQRRRRGKDGNKRGSCCFPPWGWQLLKGHSAIFLPIIHATLC